MQFVTKDGEAARINRAEDWPMLTDAVASAAAGVGVRFQSHVHFHSINITHIGALVKGFSQKVIHKKYDYE